MECLNETQLLELQILGYKPYKIPSITLDEILCILPSELNKGEHHANLSLTAPDGKYKMQWVVGYRSDNPTRMHH